MSYSEKSLISTPVLNAQELSSAGQKFHTVSPVTVGRSHGTNFGLWLQHFGSRNDDDDYIFNPVPAVVAKFSGRHHSPSKDTGSGIGRRN
jgi:hypothetical protein